MYRLLRLIEYNFVSAWIRFLSSKLFIKNRFYFVWLLERINCRQQQCEDFLDCSTKCIKLSIKLFHLCNVHRLPRGNLNFPGSSRHLAVGLITLFECGGAIIKDTRFRPSIASCHHPIIVILNEFDQTSSCFIYSYNAFKTYHSISSNFNWILWLK